MADMKAIAKVGNSILCLQNMLLSSEMGKVDALKEQYTSNIDVMFKKYNDEIDDMQSIGVLKKTKPGRGGRKKKEEPAPRPEAIPEEDEDNDDVATDHTFAVPSGNVAPSQVNGASEQEAADTTVSGRPRRAAVDAATEKMKRITEVANTRKLRRPSDFNQNDHGNYNVYNQTNQKMEDCFPRTKRRKGSTNETVVTSSQFFSSTLIHSSPLQKHIGPSGEDNKPLEMSIIPPHTEYIMECEEICTMKTRTRTLRTKKPEDKTDDEKTDRSATKKGKENETDNKQEHTDVNTTDEDATLKIKAEKKTNKKDKSKDEISSASEVSESDTGIRTRTRVQKKPVNKVEDLPVVDLVRMEEAAKPSPVKIISDKIKDKVEMFENGGTDHNDLSSEGRVTRTKTRKMNKSSDDDKSKAPADPFKVPLAVKNVKEIKKPTVKKPVDKAKEVPVVDMKQAAIDERKRLREERAQKAAAARDQAEKEKRENALKLEREREEKLKLKRARDEKLKEEMEKKKQMTQAKIEQQKREQDAARAARLQEIMEEENRKEAQRKKEQEIQERKAQQAKLAEKLKSQQSSKAPGLKKDTAAPVELNYSISVDPIPSDEEEETHPKRPIPSWAKPINRNVALADQIYVAELILKFYDNPADFNPSVIELFGEENVRIRPRTSSAVWNRTVYE